MNCWYVYIIYCSSGKLYIGSTDNLERRYDEHRSEEHSGHFTSYDHVIKIVYSEKLGTRGQAESREKQLKKWSRAKKEALIAADLDRLRDLSKRKQ